MDILVRAMLPIVYREWCQKNNEDPLMHDPLTPEFAVLAVERAEQFMKIIGEKKNDCA